MMHLFSFLMNFIKRKPHFINNSLRNSELPGVLPFYIYMNLFSDEMSRRDSRDPMVGSSELSTCSQAGQLPRIGLWTYANLVLIRVLIWACLLHPIITNFNESLITLTVLKSHSNLVSLADRCFCFAWFFLPVLLYVADKDK